jgi:shikimate kinase
MTERTKRDIPYLRTRKRRTRSFCPVLTRCIALHSMLQSAHPPAVGPARHDPAKPIVLVGLMGVGKSTVGRRLASRMRLPFVDADVAIEEAAGMSVAEIFERFDEAYFRDGERRVILAEATAIWLRAHPDVLAERVGRRDTRPLLRGKDPRRVLAELAAIRNPIYAEAHIHITSNTAPHETTVNAILKAIGHGRHAA